MKKVILAVMCTAFLCISSSVFAVLSGGGTQADPYLVQSRADFDEFANPANSTIYWASGKYTKLMCNLDLSGTTYTQAIIAPDTNNTTSGFQGTQFKGIFDGNSQIISNLTISASGKNYIGLFGSVGSGSQIHNLGLDSVNINVTSSFYVGGLVGENDAVITSCYVAGSVRGSYYVGGMVGWNVSSNIMSCYSTGSVIGTNDDIGGLIGIIYSGTLTACYSTSSVNGYSYVGGLVGVSRYGTLSACYAAGPVSGTSTCGGLVGTKESGSITNCLWDKDTTGQTTSAGGTGKTNIQMKTLSTFTDAGWDFSATDGDSADWMMQWPGEYYPQLTWQPPFIGDINGDYKIDFSDFARMAQNWLNACSSPNWCQGADFDHSGAVDCNDVMDFADNWLGVYYRLLASVLGGNGAVSPSSQIYPVGTIAGLTATPNSGYKVKAWHGTNNDTSKSATNTVTMNSNKDVSVEFEAIPYYQLTTSVVGGNGTISPSSQQYPEGTVVTLTATPANSYYQVKTWTGTDDNLSKGTTNTVTMNSNKNVTVQFEYTMMPNGGFEMANFTFWTTSGDVFIDPSYWIEGKYTAMLGGGGTLSRTVNLPTAGDYTVSFQYACIGGCYVQINGQQYSLNADEDFHVFTMNIYGVSSFFISFSSAQGENLLVVDDCRVNICNNCQPVCGNGICDSGEEGWCPDCGGGPCNYNGYCDPWEDPMSCPDCGAGPVCGDGLCYPGEEGWCPDCPF